MCSPLYLTTAASCPPLQLDPQYRSLARDRSQAAGRKTRVMQVIDDPRNLLLRPMPVGYTKRKVRFCPPLYCSQQWCDGSCDTAWWPHAYLQSAQAWWLMISH
jgi:hypothetical protein